MNASSASESAADLAGIIRLVRRICLFRKRGESARAARLQADELVAAVAAYRLWHGPGSLDDDKLCAIFVGEADHVREALALAAVLAPDLAPWAAAPVMTAPFPPMAPLGLVHPMAGGNEKTPFARL